MGTSSDPNEKNTTSNRKAHIPWITVGTREELQQRKIITVRGRDRRIAVFWNDGEPQAVDNRCPHMGFPLDQGSVQDGILTCHWHHARFALKGGCAFDLFPETRKSLRREPCSSLERPDILPPIAPQRARANSPLEAPWHYIAGRH